MNQNGVSWLNIYTRIGAYWAHDGNMRRPHALLTSGQHASEYFDSSQLTQDPDLLADAAEDLFKFLFWRHRIYSTAGCVVGPPTGGTKLAEAIGLRMMDQHHCSCLNPVPIKRDEGGRKSMDFEPGDCDAIRGQNVLLCDDVLTTGGSIQLLEDAFIRTGGTILPVILVLVNRSGLPMLRVRTIISLIDRPENSWEPDDCHYCREGSAAIRPKDEGNWERLTAHY